MVEVLMWYGRGGMRDDGGGMMEVKGQKTGDRRQKTDDLIELTWLDSMSSVNHRLHGFH